MFYTHRWMVALLIARSYRRGLQAPPPPPLNFQITKTLFENTIKQRGSGTLMYRLFFESINLKVRYTIAPLSTFYKLRQRKMVGISIRHFKVDFLE